MPQSVNPATGETIREYQAFSADRIDQVLMNAQSQFAEWKTKDFAQRAEVLNKAADILDKRKDELAALATQEMGKLLVEAKSEVEKCAWVCRYYAEHAATFLSDSERESDARKSYVRYLPLGPVLAVMPWNFPFWQVFRFAAPTLMAGNVGILKHASNVTQCALAIESIFADAGAPQGVFQTLIVSGSEMSSIVEDSRIKAVTLTGSGPAGSKVAAIAGENFKPSLLELGGSDPFIVMPSADLDKAVQTAVKARMINNGQSCIAAKRFIVHADVYDNFADKYVSMVKDMKIGDPMDSETDLGPLSSDEIRQELLSQVKSLKDAGGRILCGGKSTSGQGFYMEPTVIADIPAEAEVLSEELFGPVALLFKVADVEEAIKLANSSPFGLGSSVWTNEDEEQDRFIDEIEAGATFVNTMVASDPRLPFGGVKNSGYGRELSKEGILAFVNAKTVSVS